jgi:hypothetical protein
MYITGYIITIFIVIMTFFGIITTDYNTRRLIKGGSVRSPRAKSAYEEICDAILAQADCSRSNMCDMFRKYYMLRAPLRDIPPIVTLDDIPHSIQYISKMNIYRPLTHIGQRKLFLSEIQFLTDRLSEDNDHIVVYAGAAPSNHTGYLAELFPSVKFILVDPNPFDVRDAKPVFVVPRVQRGLTIEEAREAVKKARDAPIGIYIINCYFTLEIATAIKELLKPVYFISDIRTNSGTGMPDTLDILWNLAQQYIWIDEMKPLRSLLKFRHPFYDSDMEGYDKEPYASDFNEARRRGLDFVSNYNSGKHLIYYDGQINIQAWPGESSTETRLDTAGLKLHDYGNTSEYENKLFYYNKIERGLIHHVNPNADSQLGFDHCNDCSLENLLWTNYINRYKSPLKVRDLVIKLSKITFRGLRRDYHGDFYTQSLEQKKKAISTYISRGALLHSRHK